MNASLFIATCALLALGCSAEDFTNRRSHNSTAHRELDDLSLAVGGRALPQASLDVQQLFSQEVPTSPGKHVGTAGDVNGDGYPDLIISDPSFSAAGPEYNHIGQFSIYSGRDKSVLFSVTGAAVNDYMGINPTALGDIDGDGFDDVGVMHRVGEPYRQVTYLAIFSGRDHGRMADLPLAQGTTWPEAVRSIGDINQDTVPDYAILFSVDFASSKPYSWKLVGYSGKDNTILYSRLTAEANAAGQRLAFEVAGDVNGDGLLDVIVGVPGYEADGNRGRADVISGKNGSTLFSKFGRALTSKETGVGFGVSVGSAGDINGDGYADVLIGAPSQNVKNDSTGNNIGRVYVYSGKDGSELLFKTGEVTDAYFGSAVAGIGDFDGDGAPDFAIAARGNPESHDPKFYVYSGATNHALLYSISAEGSLGFSTDPRRAVFAIGDFDRNGKMDLGMVMQPGVPLDDTIILHPTFVNISVVGARP